MRIIISPAKKMNVDVDSLPWRDLPAFLLKTEYLAEQLKKMSYKELKNLWKCNDTIAALNAQRLSDMDLRQCLTPAILAYEGIQYRYMSPGVFTDREYEYIQNHLRILSGFYGILRPFDGVVPYRLEMQAKLKTETAIDLYAYWNSTLAEYLFGETKCILNLASKEYSLCVSKYLRPDIRFITCIFAEKRAGKVIEKGNICKMARGEMVRYMAENQCSYPEQIQSFDRLDYRFDNDRSTESTFVFIRNSK